MIQTAFWSLTVVSTKVAALIYVVRVREVPCKPRARVALGIAYMPWTHTGLRQCEAKNSGREDLCEDTQSGPVMSSNNQFTGFWSSLYPLRPNFRIERR